MARRGREARGARRGARGLPGLRGGGEIARPALWTLMDCREGMAIRGDGFAAIHSAAQRLTPARRLRGRS
jgi:hypothetical protein